MVLGFFLSNKHWRTVNRFLLNSISRNCCVIGNKSSEHCTSLLPLNCGIKRMWWIWFCFLPLPKCKKATPRVLLRVDVAAYLLCPKITHLIYFWLCKFSSHYLCPLLNNILITLLFQLPAQILLFIFTSCLLTSECCFSFTIKTLICFLISPLTFPGPISIWHHMLSWKHFLKFYCSNLFYLQLQYPCSSLCSCFNLLSFHKDFHWYLISLNLIR